MATAPDMTEIKGVLLDILGALRGNRRNDEKKTEGKYYRDDKTASGTLDAYEKLRREIEYQKQVVKDSRFSFRKLRDEVIGMVKPLGNLERAFKDTEKELKSSIRHTSTEYKKISQATFDAFKDVIKSGKNFDVQLKTMTDGQSRFIKALNKVQEAQGSEKGADGSNERIKYAKNLAKANKELRDAFKKLQETKNGEISLAGINAKAIKTGKANAVDLAEMQKIMKRNRSATLQAAESAHSTVSSFSQNQSAVMTKYLATAAGAIIEKTIPQIMKDFQARRFYGINESLGTKDVINNLGMSEEERATLVGNNQTLYRSMGNGNENAPFQTKMFHDLQQNMLTNFGLYGKEAAEKITDFGNTMIQSGFRPTFANLKTFSDNIKIAAVVLGESPDVVKDFYASLNETGQMALLQQAYSDRSENERLDLIQKNTTFIIQLNKTMGLSIEEMKKQNQLAMSQKYAGLEQAIRQEVGRGMVVDQYNAVNPNDRVSRDMYALGTNKNLQDALFGNAKTETDQKNVQDQITAAVNAAQKVDMQMAVNTNKQYVNAAGTGNFDQAQIGVSTNNLMYQIASGLLGQDLGSRSEQALADFQKRKGQGTSGIINSGQDVTNAITGGRTAGTNIDDIKIDAVNKAADKMTAALDESAIKLKEFATQLESITKNPAGGPAVGILGFAKEYFTLKALEKGGGKLFNVLKGRLFGAGAGAAAEGLGAAGAGAAEGVAAGGAAAAGGTAAGITAAGAGAAIGAGALIGGAVGTVATKVYDSTKYGKDVNSAINILASNGVEAAIMKMHAMMDPIYAAGLTSMPKDKMAALDAHKSALRYLTDTLGESRLQSWDSGSYDSKSIMAQVKNGNLSVNDLKEAGASDDFLNSMAEELNKNPSNDKIIEILKDISENTKKTTEQQEEAQREAQYRFDTAQAIQARIDKSMKSASDISKAVNARIASVT